MFLVILKVGGEVLLVFLLIGGMIGVGFMGLGGGGIGRLLKGFGWLLRRG